MAASSSLTVLGISFYLSFFAAHALQLPFHPHDFLPLLPRQVSWPILNYLNSAVDLLPTFVGATSSPNGTVEWKGACFYKNKAWMEFHNKTGNEFGGGTLHIEVKHGLICLALIG